MDEIMALCKRRGFVFQASEIYGGLNGFWDYGPLGAQLKKNLRDAWWADCVLNPPAAPGGGDVAMVGLDTCIIQHPKVWEASGHVAGFNDPMVDCRESKKRYRADHLWVRSATGLDGQVFLVCLAAGGAEEANDAWGAMKRRKDVPGPIWDLLVQASGTDRAYTDLSPEQRAAVLGPDASKPGSLTDPRPFNLMFPTIVGATGDWETNKAYLRPETAQGIFVNFKNVVDTSRVRVPFGIAQTGKAFRNEVTPRNFTFRSREFEQMEIEFFCRPEDAREWYVYWRDNRLAWWRSLGLASDNLRLREHDADELAHYAKEGAGTSDIEYRFPFTFPGFGELEGVSHRSDFDLRQHQQHSGVKMDYFDQERNERYIPHVIEPSAGLDRGVLALLCEAYTPDPERASKVYMKFHPRIAPIKAAVFPLVNKDGMPEVAERLRNDLRARFSMIEYDAKQSIGKRYARMDEAGCPFCFTIDGETLTDNSVTVRDRDTLSQERIALDAVVGYLADRLGSAR
ncbi:MAG: glycine--tRNA ligase [Phycisphaerales bacterium]|nr:MAG: glycine--tRNA ligase [Phycisphaerales bacterium]